MGHPCQKQPSTNIAIFFLVNTMSGDPGRFDESRYPRRPSWYKRRRRSTSGLVFLARTRDIISERLAGVNRSAAIRGQALTVASSQFHINLRKFSRSLADPERRGNAPIPGCHRPVVSAMRLVPSRSDGLISFSVPGNKMKVPSVTNYRAQCDGDLSPS